MGTLSFYKNIPESYNGNLLKIASTAERRKPMVGNTILVAKIKAQISRF
jgi:hypothetical protein